MIPAIAADGSLYPIEKLEAHRKAVLHLAVSVFVFAPDGRLLVQRRAMDKYHCAGQWANTCCTHPHWGEPAEACALRRLREELGFSVPLEKRRTVEYDADVGGGLFEHEQVTMFTAIVEPASVAIRPNPAEVAQTRWASLAALKTDIAARPEDFTPWFRIYLDRFPDLAL